MKMTVVWPRIAGGAVAVYRFKTRCLYCGSKNVYTCRKKGGDPVMKCKDCGRQFAGTYIEVEVVDKEALPEQPVIV